jgi:hypothetical protein
VELAVRVMPLEEGDAKVIRTCFSRMLPSGLLHEHPAARAITTWST